MPRGRPKKDKQPKGLEAVKSEQVKDLPPKPPKTPSDAAREQIDNLPPKLEQAVSAAVDAILAELPNALEPFLERLERTIFLAARVAAADLIRTSQKPETVLDGAIKEGRLAHAILTAQNEAKEVKPCPQT